jgi:hypothetical protein
VLFSSAVRLSHGCSLNMMLDEVSDLYWCSIAAAQRRFCICFFRTFPMQVATTAPQTSRGLLTVDPDMAKALPVVALCKASLSSV